MIALKLLAGTIVAVTLAGAPAPAPSLSNGTELLSCVDDTSTATTDCPHVPKMTAPPVRPGITSCVQGDCEPQPPHANSP
ncbi:hypothetical protein [Mycobacterium vicinigordonae]|uniref:Intersectin-EH binding protein Ibp1 n=1 Tax=Mycobacterium vicinigordonae TaxID=1719132 RepID=A0A7D6HV91_9MYCO|nr:hypothetical protein [Mycobacterium vicinigordonae]QLL08252.1 hypothetical protein H0P51_04610 [Mycobacterium vicinigordonae]